jgi:hypothetical protein
MRGSRFREARYAPETRTLSRSVYDGQGANR